MLLHITLHTLIHHSGNDSFLEHFDFSYFFMFHLLAFVLWLCFINQMEKDAWFYAASISMVIFPTLEVPFIENLAWELLNNSPTFHLPRILTISGCLIAIYFAIACFRQKEISLFRRFFPLVLLVFNLFSLTYLLISNENNVHFLQDLRHKTIQTSCSAIVTDIRGEDVQNYSQCTVIRFSTSNGDKLYSVFTQQMEEAELYPDIEEGDSIYKKPNSKDAYLVKKNGEKEKFSFFY